MARDRIEPWELDDGDDEDGDDAATTPEDVAGDRSEEDVSPEEESDGERPDGRDDGPTVDERGTGAEGADPVGDDPGDDDLRWLDDDADDTDAAVAVDTAGADTEGDDDDAAADEDEHEGEDEDEDDAGDGDDDRTEGGDLGGDGLDAAPDPVPDGATFFDQDDAPVVAGPDRSAPGGVAPAGVTHEPAAMGAAALQVLVSRLVGIAEEMGAVLRRAAFSPNIKERADCSAALFDADGELLVQAEHIPVHLGSMPAAVRAAIDAFADEIEPGEQIVLNDPFAGGTHLNDITVVAPCHVDGVLVGWAANRAHHADLGGATPGSIPPEATEIQQEGLRLPPVRLTPDVREVIVASSRTPDERRGDLDAQWGANVVGVTRLAAEAGRPLHEVAAYGERRMRAALADLPDGRWDFTDVLDSTGPRPDQQAAATICVGVTIAGDEITFDFTGTDEQRSGNVNAVEAVTLSAVAYALRSAVVPDLEGVGGSMRPVTVIAPEGSLVAAQPPVAVGAGNVEVSQRIADVCLGALAQVVPDRVPAASQGTMNNVLIGGDGWVYYETVGGGQGARPDRDGMNGVHTGMTNTRNTPVEALERAFPLRVRRYRLRSGSGGEGRFQGGEGIERDLEALEDVTVSLITERRVFPPWGLSGGGPGAVGENWLLPGGDESQAERVGDKVTFDLRAGDVLRMCTPGGGGWGSPTP